MVRVRVALESLVISRNSPRGLFYTLY